MKQEHEMTPGVLVSGEVLSAGDARARVAVLEAEVAELRKRVSVPEGHVVVPSVVVEFLKGAGALEGLWFGQSGIDRGAFWWRKYLFAAAPAPVERVEQEAKVFWVLFDNTGGEKYIKKDADAGTLAFFDNEEDAARAKRFNPGTDYKRVEYYTTPQPAPTAAHPDDRAVDRFADAMKAKLAVARSKGRSGWDDPAACSVEYLAQLLREHLAKGNAGTFEDVANFCMMLHQRGADPAVLAPTAAQDVAGLVEAGNILSNAAYNLAQKHGEPLDEYTCGLLSTLRKRWDEALAAHQQREGGATWE